MIPKFSLFVVCSKGELWCIQRQDLLEPPPKMSFWRNSKEFLTGCGWSSVSLCNSPNQTSLTGFTSNHRETIQFHILTSSLTPLILGYAWLEKHNPDIKWAHWRVVLFAMLRIFSLLCPQLMFQQLSQGKLKNPQISLMYLKSILICNKCLASHKSSLCLHTDPMIAL